MKNNHDSEIFLTNLVIESAKLNDLNISRTNGLEFKVQTQKAEYIFSPVKIEGDLSYVYSGYINNPQRTEVVLKLIKDVQDNDLAQNEIKALNHLFSGNGAQIRHLSGLLDQFKSTTGQIGLILTKFDGFDLRTVRENRYYKNGISDQHVAWMMCRLLSVLGYAHKNGIIHGNIEPSHILIQPADHNLCLIDWSCSVFDPAHTNDVFKVFNEDFSAPEILEKKMPSPTADLYSVGKCMLYLLGGDIKNNTFPPSVEARIQSYIRQFLLPSPFQRAQDAWKMYSRLEKLRTEIWGEQRFQEFQLK